MKQIENIREKIKKTPYRGVISEIAKEQQVSRQAIWESVFVYQNPRIMTILSSKLRQRKNRSVKIAQELQTI